MDLYSVATLTNHLIQESINLQMDDFQLNISHTLLYICSKMIFETIEISIISTNRYLRI